MQHFILDADVGDRRLQTPLLFVVFAALQNRFAASQKPVTPLGERGDRNPVFARCGLEVGLAQKFRNY